MMDLYSCKVSQWAQVIQLGIAYKKISKDQFNTKEINLLTGENLEPEYVEVNPNGTVPSLTSSSLPQPIIESVEILNYLDKQYPSAAQLSVRTDSPDRQVVSDIIDLVHSDRMSTNLILIQARNAEEMRRKQASLWKPFVEARQEVLGKNREKRPADPFYATKLPQNTGLYKLYTETDMTAPHFSAFFKQSDDAYKVFAAGLDELDRTLALPYAAGENVTEADMHVVPWLAHGMWGAGGSEVDDFGPLEAAIQVSVPGFVVGSRIKEWWANVARCDWFKEVYVTVH